ncbi:hypothetical protein BKA62DRAFT_729348 [Auriculariales sp. MPI-PUGE-AT-0066]|nr:hypothetical protein BKA62DRAFT_729348 [Auriculariales sp. MPI-PUGE-AT-0066]
MSLNDRVAAAANQHAELRVALDVLASVPSQLDSVQRRIHALQTRIASNSSKSLSPPATNTGRSTPVNRIHTSSPSPSLTGSTSGGVTGRPGTPGATSTWRFGTLVGMRKRSGSTATGTTAVVRRTKSEEWFRGIASSGDPQKTLKKRSKEMDVKDVIHEVGEDPEDERDDLLLRLDQLNESNAMRSQRIAAMAALYSWVFDGVTPEEPDDDRLEVSLKLAESDFLHLSPRHSTEQRSHSLIKETLSYAKALSPILEQLLQLGVAADLNHAMAWGNTAGPKTLERERIKAQAMCERMNNLMKRACRVNQAVVVPAPAVLTVPDIAMDEPFQASAKTRYAISAFREEVAKWTTQAERERARSQKRLERVQEALTAAADRVESARTALFDFRHATFGKYLARLSSSATPSRHRPAPLPLSPIEPLSPIDAFPRPPSTIATPKSVRFPSSMPVSPRSEAGMSRPETPSSSIFPTVASCDIAGRMTPPGSFMDLDMELQSELGDEFDDFPVTASSRSRVTSHATAASVLASVSSLSSHRQQKYTSGATVVSGANGNVSGGRMLDDWDAGTFGAERGWWERSRMSVDRTRVSLDAPRDEGQQSAWF